MSPDTYDAMQDARSGQKRGVRGAASSVRQSVTFAGGRNFIAVAS